MAKAKGKSQKSHLEFTFLKTWEAIHGLKHRPALQFRFAAPDRQWRFDFCWIDVKVAVEIDGGIFVGGGHSRGVQFTGDCEKLNRATMMGWRVLRYTTLDMRKRPVQVVEEVTKLCRMLATGEMPTQKELFTCIEESELLPVPNVKPPF